MDSLFYDINLLVEEFIDQNCTKVTAQQLGLDSRAGKGFYVSRQCLVVPKIYDQSLQYYGGFEYVDKEFRREAGDAVFYSTGDRRVEGYVSRIMENYQKVVDSK